MKHIRSYFLLTLLVLSCLISQAQITLRVISDPHVLASEYAAQFKATGSANMDSLSAEIFSAAITQIITERTAGEPTTLLICGDLTYNGERRSHEYVISELRRLKEAGIETLVIPGNHDLCNRHAALSVSADGEAGSMISRADFRTLYADFGFANAEASLGLSYVRRLTPQLGIICLDDALDDGGNTYYSDGTLTRATLNWMQNQAKALRADGAAVIAMVHHQVLEHFMGEESFFSNRIVNASDSHNDGVSTAEVRRAFADAGIQYIFTGHFHAQDAQKLTIADSEGQQRLLYDISTGSLSSSRNYIRKVHVNGKGTKFDVSASRVALPHRPSFEAEAEQQLKAYDAALVKQYMDKAVSKLGIGGNISSLAAPFIPSLSGVFDTFFQGSDSNAAPFGKKEEKLLDIVKVLQPQLYNAFDSMSRNYIANPSNVTPDINIPGLPLEVNPPVAKAIEQPAGNGKNGKGLTFEKPSFMQLMQLMQLLQNLQK